MAVGLETSGRNIEEVKAALHSLQENPAARRAGRSVLKGPGEGPEALGASRGPLLRPSAPGKPRRGTIAALMFGFPVCVFKSRRRNQELQELQESREIQEFSACRGRCSVAKAAGDNLAKGNPSTEALWPA